VSMSCSKRSQNPMSVGDLAKNVLMRDEEVLKV